MPTEGPRGVKIHFGGFHGGIMAESVAAFALAWARGMFRPELRTKPWPRNELSGVCYEVAGTLAVIAGYGRVGRAIGAKLESLGVSVAGITRHGVFAGGRRLAKTQLSKLLAAADWFVMALPSTTGTDDILSASMIAKLPRRCVVVNVGRGNAIDEHALYRALKSRRLAGACLDVRKHEPSATVLESPGYVPEARVRFSFGVSGVGRVNGDRMFVRVFPYQVAMNAQKSARKHDMVVGRATTSRDSVFIVVPEGYAVEHLPEGRTLSCPVADFRQEFRQVDGGVLAVCEIRMKPGRMPAADYPEYRELAKAVNKAYESSLVLKKNP